MSSWLTQGAEAAKALQVEKQRQAERAESSGRLFRFYLKEGEEARITFVDGFLAKEGVNAGCLTFAAYYEHTVAEMSPTGRKDWNQYVCLHGQGNTSCPLCEEDNKAAFVGAFTVIDHRVTKSKDGTKTYKDQKRLFVAKSSTLQMLTQLASKRGGLAGCTFDVYRTSKTDANVGNIFDFIERNEVEELKKQFVVKDKDEKEVTYFTPADYEKELPFKSEAELRSRGFGTGSIGKEPALPPESSSTVNYSGDL
jgi:hypothetical protein